MRSVAGWAYEGSYSQSVKHNSGIRRRRRRRRRTSVCQRDGKKEQKGGGERAR